MSHGRHSRPHARGGGLASLLALALAGGGVAIGLNPPASMSPTLQLCVMAGAAVGAIGLLMLARLQRTSSRALARTEERLRVLEQRSRDESGDLHRRVLEAVAREGEMRRALEALSAEIGRLRASLDGFAAPVGAAVATLAERAAAPYPAVPYPGALDPTATFDLPLVQRAFAEPVDLLPAEAADAAVEPVAGELWLPPARPEPVPVAADAASGETRSWVVREIDLDDADEPVAALTMRILDLRTRQSDDTADVPQFARPA